LLSSDALRGFYSDLEAGGLDARNRRLSEIEEWDDPLSFIILPLGRIPCYTYASLKLLPKTQWEKMIGERVHSIRYLYCCLVKTYM
jgi:hypothetical protein